MRVCSHIRLSKSFCSPLETPLLSAWISESQEDQSTETSPAVEEELLAPPRKQPSAAPVATPSTPSTGSLFSNDDFPPLPSPVASPPIVHQAPPPEPVHPMVTRGKDGIRKPNPRYALISVTSQYPEPKTLAAALKDPHWNNSMKHEKNNMEITHTWDLVPPDPSIKPINCGWVHKSKLNADGTLNKRKSRLVARGNEQEEGIDFVETYSPVVRTATIRSVLHVAAVKGWTIKQLDVENAFLHGDLKEHVFMKQPPGFADPEKPDYICKLRKAIYGLRQSPRAWFDKFSIFLIEFGFKCTHGDPSLFVYHHGDGVIYLLLYVDDMLLTGNNDKLMETLLVHLNTTFRMKDMGLVHYFLGIQVTHTSDGLFLCQEKYTTDLLATAGMSDCVPMPTPLPIQLDRVPGQDELFSEPSYFRSLAGKL